jgi:anti-sigma-K factor RskA
MIPDNPIERDGLAGEYVLGVLDRASRAAMTAALDYDDDLRRRVEAWQNRLQPLADIVPPVTPPTDLWRRIETGLQPRAIVRPIRPSARPGVWHSARIWQVATGGMTALAAGLAVLMLSGNLAYNPSYIGVQTMPQHPEASFLVESRPRSGLEAISLSEEGMPAGHAYELWAVSEESGKPIPLGVIPAGGKLTLAKTRFAPSRGMELMISLEPDTGGSIETPTGPVLYQAHLMEQPSS